jgi:hypothetical protein
MYLGCAYQITLRFTGDKWCRIAPCRYRLNSVLSAEAVKHACSPNCRRTATVCNRGMKIVRYTYISHEVVGETSPLCCNKLGCIKTPIIVVKTQQNCILHYVLTVH